MVAAMPSTRSSSPTREFEDEHLLGQYIPLLYHYNMLQDEDRVQAFRDAIQVVVKPGMHVVELGGGTGILSSFAARCGARVSCVERNPELVATARRFVLENKLTASIEVIGADASRFIPDSKVDVVVCEMLHVGLLREKQAQVIAAFKRNYFQEHGGVLPVFIPEVSMLMVQPIQQSFDFAGYTAPVPMFQAPLLEQPRTRELAKLSAYATIAYDESFDSYFDIDLRFKTIADGLCNAVRFVTQNVLTIDMSRERAITWPNQCLVLPTGSSIAVDAGDDLRLRFTYSAGDLIESLSDSIGLYSYAPT